MSTTTTAPQLNKTQTSFMTIEEFKRLMQVQSMQVVKNPHTGKLFIWSSHGNFKCEQALDMAANMCFLIPDGVVENACLVNATPSQNIVGSI